ncbi:hypothetical protein [Methanopyrus sp.]
MLRVLLLYPRSLRYFVIRAYRELPSTVKPDSPVLLASCDTVRTTYTRLESNVVTVGIGAARDFQEVKASLAHELAHVLQFEHGVMPVGGLPPLRALALPLEVGAEELVLRELPDVAVRRLEMGLRYVTERRTDDPLSELERSLALEPLKLAAERLDVPLHVPEVEPERPEVAKVKRRLLRSVRRVDPWSPLEVQRYLEDAWAEVTVLATLSRGA